MRARDQPLHGTALHCTALLRPRSTAASLTPYSNSFGLVFLVTVRVVSTGTGVLIPANLTVGVGDAAVDVLATFAAQRDQIRTLTALSASQAATIAALLLRLEALEAANQQVQTDGLMVATRVSALEGEVGHATAPSSILGRLTVQHGSLASINATASTLTSQVRNLETLHGASALVATLTDTAAPASLVARIASAEAKSLAPESTGTIVWRASTTSLAGYLPCDGASLSRLSYATLFVLLGTTFGSKDSSSFSLPDLRGRVMVGSGLATGATSARALGSTFGSEVHALSTAEMPLHSHGCTIIDGGEQCRRATSRRTLPGCVVSE